MNKKAEKSLIKSWEKSSKARDLFLGGQSKEKDQKIISFSREAIFHAIDAVGFAAEEKNESPPSIIVPARFPDALSAYTTAANILKTAEAYCKKK